MIAMVAVDLNLLIGAVVSVSLVAYILILRKMRAKPDSKEAVSSSERGIEAAGEARSVEAAKMPEPTLEFQSPPEKPRMKCSHSFGYLSGLRKNINTPEECLQCNRVERCRNRKTKSKTRTKRKTAVNLAMEEPKITT